MKELRDIGGKLFPVLVMDDGTMYSVRMSKEDLEMFQITVSATLGEKIIVDPEPLNNGCSYKIFDKSKNK